MKNIAKKLIDTLGYHIMKKEEVMTHDGIPVYITDQNFINIYNECKRITISKKTIHILLNRID